MVVVPNASDKIKPEARTICLQLIFEAIKFTYINFELCNFSGVQRKSGDNHALEYPEGPLNLLQCFIICRGRRRTKPVSVLFIVFLHILFLIET